MVKRVKRRCVVTSSPLRTTANLLQNTSPKPAKKDIIRKKKAKVRIFQLRFSRTTHLLILQKSERSEEESYEPEVYI